MTDTHTEQYWSSQFDITLDDLDRVSEELRRDGRPQEEKEIALRIIERRLDPEADPGNEQAESILLEHGENILSLLKEALESDPRFTGLEGKWFLAERLPYLEPEALQTVHRTLLQNPSASIEEILSLLNEQASTDEALMKLALQTALLRLPERFENIGTLAYPQWKARLPEIEHAAVTHYAYDPQTYEILCRPGQRLSPKKAARLQELNLYGYVVSFAE
jgi:hypothetical protein